MARFSDLPVEVVENIVKSVNGVGSNYRRHTASYYALCLTSRALRQLATPLLYHTYDKCGPLLLFTSTVLSNPTLARHVKVFAADIQEGPPDTLHETFQGDRMRISQVQSLVKAHIAKTGIGDQRYQKAWLDDIFPPEEADLDGPYDTLEALLLIFLPSLENITYGPGIPGFRMTKTLESASRLDVLKNVVSVDLYVEDGQWGFSNVTQCAPFFRLPNIRCFGCSDTLDDWSSAQRREDMWPVAPRSSTVDTLSFEGGALWRTNLEYIVESCKTLKSFTYHYGALSEISWRAESVVTPSSTLIVLRAHAETIEELDIDFADHEWFGKDAWPEEEYVLGDLTGFHSLRRLALSQQALTGLLARQCDEDNTPIDLGTLPTELEGVKPLRQVLPTSLESLTIYYCDLRVVPKVESLFLKDVYGGTSFDKLHKIHLIFARDSPFTTVTNICEQLSILHQTVSLTITADLASGLVANSPIPLNTDE